MVCPQQHNSKYFKSRLLLARRLVDLFTFSLHICRRHFYIHKKSRRTGCKYLRSATKSIHLHGYNSKNTRKAATKRYN